MGQQPILDNGVKKAVDSFVMALEQIAAHANFPQLRTEDRRTQVWAWLSTSKTGLLALVQDLASRNKAYQVLDMVAQHSIDYGVVPRDYNNAAQAPQQTPKPAAPAQPYQAAANVA